MDFFDDKLALFMDKGILQETVDTSVDKGIDLVQVRWFTQPENRIALAELMFNGKYHIAPPHIIQIPKRDSSEMRKVYCNEPLDRIVCAQIRLYARPTRRSIRVARWPENRAKGPHCQGHRGLSFQPRVAS